MGKQLRPQNNEQDDFDPREAEPMKRDVDVFNVGKWMTQAHIWKRRFLTLLDDYKYLREAVRKVLFAIDQGTPEQIEHAVAELVEEYERKSQ